MDTLGIEPRAFGMRSGCATTMCPYSLPEKKDMIVSLSLLPFLEILSGGPQACPSHLVHPANPVRNKRGLYWQDAWSERSRPGFA